MPNNASARRVKDKRNKDKKGEGSKKTDTLSLPKEDAASVDSGTLSLSSAGKDNSSKDSVDGSSLSLSVVSHVNRDSTGTALLGLPRRIAASITIKSTHHPPFTRWLVISQSPASSHSQPLTQKAHVLARWTLWTRFASSFSD